MSNTTHTPGKWTTEPHGKTTALYSGRDSQNHGLRLMNLDDGDSNFKANAALIARSPEMAERIEWLEAKVFQLNEFIAHHVPADQIELLLTKLDKK